MLSLQVAAEALVLPCRSISSPSESPLESSVALRRHLLKQQKSLEITQHTTSSILGTSRPFQNSAKKVIKEHPEVDCLINNAAVQKPLDINNFDLQSTDQEIDINIRGPMHLTIGFLEHLKSKEAATIINISSLLGYIPTSIINPVYNATKA